MNFYTFHSFPKLPLEIRRLVWLYALPPSNRVNAHLTPVQTQYEPRPRPTLPEYEIREHRRDPSQSCRSDPWLLYANRESREVALEHYERRIHYQASVKNDSTFAQFVSFEIDRFYFNTIHFFAHARNWKSADDLLNISKADLGKMRKLELGFGMPEFLDSQRWGFLLWIDAWLPCFAELREISILVYSNHEDTEPRISTIDFEKGRVNDFRARSERKLEDVKSEKERSGIVWEPPTLTIWDMKSETILEK
jgi:hypothetical protein